MNSCDSVPLIMVSVLDSELTSPYRALHCVHVLGQDTSLDHRVASKGGTVVSGLASTDVAQVQFPDPASHVG